MIRTPLRPQFQTTECGVAVLRIIFAHFGFEPSTVEIRHVSGVSRDCVSATDLRRTARAFGFDCKALSLEPPALAGLALPVIVHLNFIHFVVLETVEADHVRLNCPASGRIAMSHAEFDGAFTGIVLAISPTDVSPTATRERVAERAWWRWIARRSGPGLDAALRARIAERFQELPLSFFGYRLVEILYALVLSTYEITRAIHYRLVPAVLGLVGALGVIGGVAAQSWSIGVTFLVILLAWLAGVGWCSRWRRHWDHGKLAADGLADPVFAALARPHATKLGDGMYRFWRSRTGKYARDRATDMVVRPALLALGYAPHALLAALLTAAGLMSGEVVRTGDMSVAAAVAIVVLMEPATRLRGVVAELRSRGFHWRDVIEEPISPAREARAVVPPIVLSVENLAFRFSPTRSPVFANVDLALMPGEQVALVGPSGCGKSTLTKVLAGIYPPLEGEVRILPVDPTRRMSHVLRVDRQATIFAGTVRDNLTLGDETITPEDLAAAVSDSGLDKVLAERVGGLDTLIEWDGRNFSGGQLQRLEIARALARNPAVLILDDALDALELASELRLRSALRRRGCALLLASHRASSIAACDRIIELLDLRHTAMQAPETPRPATLALFGARREREPAAPIGVHAAALMQAIAALLPSVTRQTENIADQTVRTILGSVAEESGHRLQRLDIVEPAWWHADFGRILAFRADDGTPVALDTARLDAVERRTAFATYRPDAYAFVPSYAGPLATIGDWLRCTTERDRRETMRVCIAATGAAAILIPLAAGLRVPMSVSHAAALLVLAACGILVLRLKHRAMDRLITLSGQASVEGFTVLLGRIRGDVLARLSPLLTMRGLYGLERASRSRIAMVDRLFPAAIAIVSATIAIVTWLPVATFGALLLALAVLALLPVLAAAIADHAEQREPAAGLAARRYLGVLIAGVARLRQLGVDRDAFARWTILDHLWQRLMRRIALVTAAAGMLQAIGTVAIVALLAGVGQTVRDQVLLSGIGWILARSSLAISAVLGTIVRDRHVHRAAVRLLREVGPDGGIRVDAADAIIAVRHATVRYGRSLGPALDDISVTIQPGRLTVLAGPSGSGKSTLLRVLLGLQSIDSGSVEIGGHALEDIDSVAWRRGVAGVFQGDRLEQTVTIRGQLSIGGDYTLDEIWRVLDVVEMTDEIRILPMGLQTIVEVDSLSTGQQQRLLIAAALLRDPKLMILDEATNAIADAMQARIVRRLLDRGIGCVAVTHRETMIALAEQVYEIEAGRVIRSWTQANRPVDCRKGAR